MKLNTNKKISRGRIVGGAFVGEKVRFELPRVKSAVSGNRGGHSGNGPHPARHRKQHNGSIGRPGTPNGVCVWGSTNLPDAERRMCRCGGHSARRRT